MKKILFLLCFFPLLSFSQTEEEITSGAPRPFQLPPDYDEINKTGIKFVYIIGKNMVAGRTREDTVSVHLYNREGLNTSIITYEYNRPVVTSLFLVNGRKKETQVTFHEGEEKDHTGRIFYEFDDAGRETMMKVITVNKKDTIKNIVEKRIFKGDRLVKKELITNGRPYLSDSFFYQDNRLLFSRNYFGKKKDYLSVTHYTYNGNGQLYSSLKATHIQKDSTLPRKKKIYQYENGELIEETELDMRKEGTPSTTTRYTYEAGKLKTMESNLGSYYQNVLLTYTGEKISSIKLTTNTDLTLNSQIPYNLSGKSLPLVYEVQLSYDAKGNVVSKKILIDSVLVQEIIYTVIYYN
jgi:hypothetical protein